MTQKAGATSNLLAIAGARFVDFLASLVAVIFQAREPSGKTTKALT